MADYRKNVCISEPPRWRRPIRIDGGKTYIRLRLSGLKKSLIFYLVQDGGFRLSVRIFPSTSTTSKSYLHFYLIFILFNSNLSDLVFDQISQEKWRKSVFNEENPCLTYFYSFYFHKPGVGQPGNSNCRLSKYLCIGLEIGLCVWICFPLTLMWPCIVRVLNVTIYVFDCTPYIRI